MGITCSVPNSYFEALYARSPDPWDLASSSYELAKYRETIDRLEGRKFASGFEVGCSIGVLTRMLAGSCDRLLAVDATRAALGTARKNCAGLGNVTFERRRIPQQWPVGWFDLMVFSEVLYYLSHRELRLTAERVCRSLLPGGTILLVHWSGSTGWPMEGDEAVESFIAACGERVRVELQSNYGRYRLDRLRLPLKADS